MWRAVFLQIGNPYGVSAQLPLIGYLTIFNTPISPIKAKNNLQISKAIFSHLKSVPFSLLSPKNTRNERTNLSVNSSFKNGSLAFSEVLDLIATYYNHQPTAFKNGDAYNEATQNQGSAKVFTFAKLNDLSAEDTLYLFAEHYQSVLANPDATDHQNIRQFMTHGWPGVVFEGEALIVK